LKILIIFQSIVLQFMTIIIPQLFTFSVAKATILLFYFLFFCYPLGSNRICFVTFLLQSAVFYKR